MGNVFGKFVLVATSTSAVKGKGANGSKGKLAAIFALAAASSAAATGEGNASMRPLMDKPLQGGDLVFGGERVTCYMDDAKIEGDVQFHTRGNAHMTLENVVTESGEDYGRTWVNIPRPWQGLPGQRGETNQCYRVAGDRRPNTKTGKQ